MICDDGNQGLAAKVAPHYQRIDLIEAGCVEELAPADVVSMNVGRKEETEVGAV